MGLKFFIPQSSCPFISTRSTPEHLNVTTFLGSNSMAATVPKTATPSS